MELHSLDNFPTPKSEWPWGLKLAVVIFTLGIGYSIWRYFTKREEAAQEGIAESKRQAERAKLEKATTEKVVEQVVGQGVLTHVQNIVNTQLPKEGNSSDMESPK